MDDLRALHLIYNAIKHYQALGVAPETRDELLTIAGRAIGTKPRTLCAAISEIEIAIARLRGGQQCHN
jgi:hypothetical protein